VTLRSKFLLAVSKALVIDGLWVGSVERDSVLFQRISEALALIKTRDRRRYSRLLRDLKKIWIRLLPGDVARFEPSLSACEIDTRFVRDQPPDIIATVIVHEATHARIMRAGVRYEESRRQKIERICIRQEMIFASKLPDGEAIAQWSRTSLQIPPDLSDAALAQRELAGNLEILRYCSTPEWLIRVVLTSRSLRKRFTR
jgi:hypothetical protein